MYQRGLLKRKRLMNSLTFRGDNIQSKNAKAPAFIKLAERRIVQISQQDFRVAILYNYQRGLSPYECYVSLKKNFGELIVPALSTIDKWYKDFGRGNVSVDASQQKSKDLKAFEEVSVDAIRRLLEVDPRVTLLGIERILGIGSATAKHLVEDVLLLKRRFSYWAPATLTEEQKETRLDWCCFALEKFDFGRNSSTENVITSVDAWLYYVDRPESSEKPGFWCFRADEIDISKRRMVSCFFSKSGLIGTMSLDNRRTLTANSYIENCLIHVIDEWRLRQPRNRLIIHQDDAPANSAARTVDYLATQGVSTLPHPPHSPDLAPSDHPLKPKNWQHLYESRFDSEDMALSAYKDCLEGVHSDIWSKIFSKWFWSLRKCVESNGDYVKRP